MLALGRAPRAGDLFERNGPHPGHFRTIPSPQQQVRASAENSGRTARLDAALHRLRGMALGLQPLGVLARWRSTYWFLPSILTAGAVALALALTAVDRFFPDATSWLGWAYGGGADGARALLSAVAGSMITVVSVTFSVLVVALTVSSQHFGPRLLTNFMRDQPAQLVLGAFTGTFAYCLMVLRTVQGDGSDRFSFFVPHLAVAGAIVLALTAVGLLIYYVHHIAGSMQVAEITRRIGDDLEKAVDNLYPDPLGAGAEPPLPPPPAAPATALEVPSLKTGYIQSFDGDRLIELAREADTVIWLAARPGDFVVEGETIAAIGRMVGDAARSANAIAHAVEFGVDRTFHQDAGFAIQQLVEVALRALSPGMNEPFTAINAIDRLVPGLRMLASRRIPSAVRTDSEGRPRVVAEPRRFDRLLAEAFEPIAAHARTQPAVLVRLLEAAERIARVATRAEDRRALQRLVDLAWTAAGDVDNERQRAALTRCRERALLAIGRPAQDTDADGNLPAFER